MKLFIYTYICTFKTSSGSTKFRDDDDGFVAAAKLLHCCCYKCVFLFWNNIHPRLLTVP